MKTEVLGIKIDDVNLTEALARIEKWIHSGGKRYIVTPNPEIIVAAQKDEILKDILNNADLSIPDGVGLRLSGRVKNTTPGVDLMEKLIKLSTEKGLTIAFLGGREGVAEGLAECLREQYQSISVTFAKSGGKIDEDGRWKMEDGALKIENRTWINTPTDILFVAFGHLKQEKWIANNLDKIPVNIFMGVGGSFDELSGRVLKCPAWIRKLGLKWLFRLINEPWRVKRQLSLIEYLWLLTRESFKR